MTEHQEKHQEKNYYVDLPEFSSDDVQGPIPDLPRMWVPLRSLGRKFCVQGMRGDEREKFERSLQSFRGGKEKRHLKDLRARIVVQTVIDSATGRHTLTDEDIPWLMTWPAADLNNLAEAGATLSGIGDRDMEDLAESFGATQVAS